MSERAGALKKPTVQGGDTEAQTQNALSKVTASGVSKARSRIQASSIPDQVPLPYHMLPSHQLKWQCLESYDARSGVSHVPVMTMFPEPTAGTH